MSRYIRTEYEGILETQTTNKCIYVIRNKNVDGENCYVSYLWDNWKNYHLIDYQNCMLFSYNSAQSFISDLIKENLNYQDLVIEISPYYKNCKQADTIEELCDEFVIDNWKEKGKPVYCFKYVKETKTAYCIDGGGYITLFIPKMLECGCIIKGAIWTEWGLKYVAKMNDKGELELI